MAEGIRRDSGGIDGLLDLIDKHGKALEADLICAGLRLRNVGSPDFTWRDLLVFVQESSQDSALFRKMYPEQYQWDNQNMLLAGILDAMNIQIWMQTKDGKYGRNKPEPIPRPGIKPARRRTKGVAVPIDQFKKRLADMRRRVAVSSAEERVTRFKHKEDTNGH